MTNRTIPLDDRLHAYLVEHSLRESEVRRRLREATATHPWSRWQIAPEQGQFMALLAELTGVERAIEIGVYTGYSALCIAEVLPPHGRLVACDISAELTALALPFWEEAGVRGRIDLRIGPALETLDRMLESAEGSTYDFAFIDADKAAYGAYYERCLDLVRPGGLVVFDNMLWGGRVADPACTDEDTVALRELNDILHRDERVSLSLVPIGDGVTVARKRG